MDIAQAYIRSLLARPALLATVCVLFLALTSQRMRLGWRRLSRVDRAAIAVVLLVAALTWLRAEMSVVDDAYISLRYARNLARGDGLVFNVGERVEGYSNFLWTLLLAAGLAMGFDGARIALFGCAAAFIATLLVVARVGLMRTSPDERPAIPLAAILLGTSYTFVSFGSTGMETMLSTLLITLALHEALAGRPASSGLWGTLAIMNHWDLALIYSGLGMALVLDRSTRPSVLRYATPFVALFVPYFLWRWHYYGDLMPNTYYAKSADLWYPAQGATYLVESALGCGVWLLLIPAGYSIWRRPAGLLERVAVLGLVPYVLYVVKVGGDFMLGRLLVPVMPLLALLAESGQRELAASGLTRSARASAVACGIAACPIQLIPSGEALHGVSDEGALFRVSQLWPEVRHGNLHPLLGEALVAIAMRGLRPTVALYNIGWLGYVSDLPIIDRFGLTDRVIAHNPLSERGRPGHEKRSPPSYLAQRHVLVSDQPLYGTAHTPPTRVTLHSSGTGAPDEEAFLYLSQYAPLIIAALRNAMPRTVIPDVPAMIDQYVSDAQASGSPPTLEKDVAFFDRYYFSANDDTVRSERLHALVHGDSSATGQE